MTITAWCKVNGICEQAYYWNLKCLHEEFCENLPVDVPDKPVTFKNLEVAKHAAAVIIRSPQAKLESNEGASQQTVQAVILALRSVC